MTTSPGNPAATYHSTVIDADTLAGRLTDPGWRIVDCRFDLLDTAAGERRYQESHIPGAVYAHLDRDLSGPTHPSGRGGRHPLPSPVALTRLFGRLGIDEGVQVVAYDDQSGHYAARLWWMLRYMGHEAVAVLDGGWPAWIAAAGPVETGGGGRPPERLFTGAPRAAMLAGVEEVEAFSQSRPGGVGLLVDGRAPERFRGEVEPLDPVAGHIPGAANRPYTANWAAGGHWRSQEALLAEYLDLLGDVAPEASVFYCGSGVSACVNLLAMARAGLPVGRLYAGSWSEWSRTGRPVATGRP